MSQQRGQEGNDGTKKRGNSLWPGCCSSRLIAPAQRAGAERNVQEVIARTRDLETVTVGRRFHAVCNRGVGVWARCPYDDHFGGRPAGLWLW